MGRYLLGVLIILSFLNGACTVKGAIDDASSTKKSVSKKVYLDSTSLTLTEGGAAVVNIAVDQKYETDTTISVLLVGMANRLQPLPLTITIPAQTLSQSLVIQTIDDNIYQGLQFLTVSISGSTSDVVAQPSFLRVALNDNETMPVLTVANASANEDAGTMTFTVTQDKPSFTSSTFQWQTQDGTATAGSDYTAVPSTLAQIAAGQLSTTLTVPILTDNLNEASETFKVILSSPTNATLAATFATGTIVNVNVNTTPVVNFTAASQSFNEINGQNGAWPASLNAWSKRRKLTISSPINETLSNFPVLVKLDSSRISYASTQSAGQDLRFTDSNGNLLSYEIESWNASGTSYVWVKVPSIAANSFTGFIFMYYGNASATDAQNTSAVWSNNYAAVWHLGTSLADVTGNGNALTDTGTTVVSGAIGSGRNLSSNYFSLPSTFFTSRSVYTLEMAFKTSSPGGVLAGQQDVAVNSTPASWDPFLYIDNSGILRGGFYTGSVQQVLSSGSVADGNWKYTSFAVNGTSWSLYLDGASLGTAGSGAPYNSTETYGQFGMGHTNYWPNTNNNWSNFSGTLDEIRVRSVVSTDGWIKAQYLSQTDSYLNYGAEEAFTQSVITVTAQLDFNAPSTVTIPFTVSGTASNPSDHNLSDGTITITSGSSTGTVQFSVFRDGVSEGDETVILTMGTPTGATLGSTTVHTVTLVDEVNAAPVATTDAISLTNWSAVTLNVLSNDSDANGDPLVITAVGSSSKGTIVNNGNGLTYTPNNGVYPGTDTFTYTISDGRGGTATGTVNLSWDVPTTWIGAGSDANWSTPANWLGGVVPDSSSVAYFNDRCTTFCNPQISSGISVGGVKIGSSFTGNIIQGSGATMTLGSVGWDQWGGTFTGSDATIAFVDFAGVSLHAGTYKATSGEWLIPRGSIFVDSSVAFNSNGGWVHVNHSNSRTYWTVTNSTVFHDVYIEGSSGTTEITGELVTTGTFTLANTFGTGECLVGNVTAKGDVSLPYYGAIENPYYGCQGRVKMAGSGNQSLITPAGAVAGLPSLEIASTGGNVSLGDFIIVENFKYTSGNVITQPSVSIRPNGYCATYSFDPGPISFNNFTVDSFCNQLNIANSFTVLGNFTVNNSSPYGPGSLMGSTISVQGDLTFNSTGLQGSTWLKLTGTGSQTLTSSGSANSINSIEIAKPSGTAYLASTFGLGSGRDFTITQGTLSFNSNYLLNIPGTLTLQSGTVINQNGGTVSQGTLVNNGGTINP